MKKRNVTILNVGLIICLTIIFFFFITIAARILTREILVKRLRWDNDIVRIVFVGNEDAVDLSKRTDGNRETLLIDWAEQYPFASEKESAGEDSNSGAWLKKILRYKDGIDYYTGTLLIGHFRMTSFAKLYNRIIGMRALPSDDVFFLSNRSLTSREELQSSEVIEEIADSVKDFSDFLSEANIPFVYANIGWKVCPYDKQLPDGAIEYSNENCDNLLRAMEERDIAIIDFREHMLKDGIDWYDAYYTTDERWKTTVSLWAAGVLADYLNEHCGFDFNNKYFSLDQYNVETYEDYHLGVYGREVTLENCELDSFEKVWPKFSTKFLLEVPTREVLMEGPYEEVLFDQKTFHSIAEYSAIDFLAKTDAYECIRARNELAHITNLQPPDNGNKKILMIQNCMSWYMTSFLATDVAQIDTIHTHGHFTGSVQEYIRQTKPDVVVLSYSAHNIRPINWTTHASEFDLR